MTTLQQPATASIMAAMNITRDDIEMLIREPSPNVRVRITDKVAAGYNTGVFSEAETKLANEIFRLLLKDTELRVRKAMADQLKSNPNVPHDVIYALASDHPEVACPVLEATSVLTEEDLVSIVRATREHPKLHAIAKRASISKQVSHALVEKRDAEVTKTLLRNLNAALSETSIETILDEFAREHSVLEQLVMRGGLSHALAEKLFAMVSDALKKQLTRKYRLGWHVVDETGNAARETAVLQFVSPWMSEVDIVSMVDQMHRNNRLTDSVIIRSLCIGDLRFFEAAIAKRVGIPVSNARILVMDPGPLGFKALYASSGLAPGFYEAIHAMLKLALSETQYGSYRTANFGSRMRDRIAEAGYDRTVPNMEVVMSMIGSTMNEPHTFH